MEKKKVVSSMHAFFFYFLLVCVVAFYIIKLFKVETSIRLEYVLGWRFWPFHPSLRAEKQLQACHYHPNQQCVLEKAWLMATEKKACRLVPVVKFLFSLSWAVLSLFIKYPSGRRMWLCFFLVCFSIMHLTTNLTYSHYVLSKSWRCSAARQIGMQKLEFLTESSVPLGVLVFWDHLFGVLLEWIG